MSTHIASSLRVYIINMVSSVLSRVVQITVFVWVNQYLIKRIPAEEYSLFPIMVSLMFFADVVKNILTAGIGRFLVEADARGDDTGVTRIVSSVFPISLAVATVFAIVGGAAAWNVDRLLNIEPGYLFQARLMLCLLVGGLCLAVLGCPFAEGAYVRQKFVTLNLLDLSCETLRIGILLGLLFGVSTKVMWLVVASTCAAGVHLVARIILTRRWVPAIRFRKELVSLKAVWPLIRFGGWTSIGGFTGLVSSTLPSLLLNRFGTSVDVAAFYLGRLPDVQIRGLAGVAVVPAQPALTSLYAKDGDCSLDALYYRGGRYHLWVALLLVAPLLVFGKEIIGLYAGSQYASAATVMCVLLVVYPLIWASAMFFQMGYAVGRIGSYYLCDIVIQGLTLLAMFYAVAYRDLGATGAAFAIALVGGGLHVLLIWPMGLRLVKGEWKHFVRQTLGPGLFPFATAVLVCLGFRNMVHLDSWFLIGCGAALAGAVYLSVLLRCCLDPFDQTLVERLTLKAREAVNRLFASLGLKPAGTRSLQVK